MFSSAPVDEKWNMGGVRYQIKGTIKPGVEKGKREKKFACRIGKKRGR